jgi:hypothetical protein
MPFPMSTSLNTTNNKEFFEGCRPEHRARADIVAILQAPVAGYLQYLRWCPEGTPCRLHLTELNGCLPSQNT